LNLWVVILQRWLKITTLENVICLENRYNGCIYNTQLALCRNEKKITSLIRYLYIYYITLLTQNFYFDDDDGLLALLLLAFALLSDLVLDFISPFKSFYRPTLSPAGQIPTSPMPPVFLYPLQESIVFLIVVFCLFFLLIYKHNTYNFVLIHCWTLSVAYLAHWTLLLFALILFGLPTSTAKGS